MTYLVNELEVTTSLGRQHDRLVKKNMTQSDVNEVLYNVHEWPLVQRSSERMNISKRRKDQSRIGPALLDLSPNKSPHVTNLTLIEHHHHFQEKFSN